jgi:hypothetical protein
MKPKPWLAGWAVLALVLAGPMVGYGQTSPEQRQAILGFKLTRPMADKLLAALPEMTRYVVAKPNFKELAAQAAKQTPAERLAAVEKDAGAMAILNKHGLSAREYLVGVPTLRMAILKAQAGDGPGSDRMIASPENVAFAKANLADLKPKLDAVDSMR